MVQLGFCADSWFLESNGKMVQLGFSLITFLLRGEDASNVAVTPIPLQNRLTQQIIKHRQPVNDLKHTFVVSRRAEQLRLHTQQRVVITAED
jgi:hypothetical protein